MRGIIRQLNCHVLSVFCQGLVVFKLQCIRSGLYLRYHVNARNSLCWVEWIELISKPGPEIRHYFLLIDPRKQICTFCQTASKLLFF
jgi:hypothetical protein